MSVNRTLCVSVPLMGGLNSMMTSNSDLRNGPPVRVVDADWYEAFRAFWGTLSLVITFVGVLVAKFRMSWPSTPRLRYLNLEGVAISSDTLISVMHQSAETMEGVYFWRVELKSGTWLKIILGMGKLPRLTDVILSRCAYSATGTSAHLDTTNAFDEAALEWLLRKINRRRIKFGYEPFNEWTMEGANEIPLKTIADHAQDIQELAEAIRSLTM